MAGSEDRSVDRHYGQPAPWRFRNWRVRTKIIAILTIPLLAVVVLAGLRMFGVLSDMHKTGRAQQVATLAMKAAALADELEAERDLSAAYVGRSHGYGAQEVHTERDRVDQAVRDYQETERAMSGDYGPVVSDLIASVDKHIQQLGQVREGVDRGVAPWNALFSDYTKFVADLISIEADIPQGSNDALLADGVRAVSSLSRMKALLSQERGSLDYVLGTGKFDETQFRDFLNIDARLNAAKEEFDGSVTETQRDLYQRTVTGVITGPVSDLTKKAMVSPSEALTLDLPDWYAKVSAVIQKQRVVEVSFGNQVLDRASALHRGAQRQAALNGGVVLAVLVVTFVLALLVARSLVRPLRRLRSAATEVAQHRLPQSVQRLRSTAAGDLDAEVETVRVNSTDEVGDVAAAFNVVHREAVRIAVEQALLRRNVSTMFINLSRRTQSLVERQLRLIDDLEVNENDNDSLGNLFQLDHLATRMRRNAENLLVLAGAESGRRWNRPVVLLDVLRAATAEVEQYPRVAQTYVTTREIDGRAVGDVVHLIAELLENALEFSSPETQVVVSARSLRGDGGVLVEIEDRGIGMSAEELAAANERLATSAEIDVGLSRMMGLYVVGKLARRHNIEVALRHAATGGVLAQIRLPASIVVERADADDDIGAYLRSRADDGAVPAAVGASAAAEPADLGDHETRPIIVERTRTRPRPLSRTEDDRTARSLREPPGAGRQDSLSQTGTHQAPAAPPQSGPPPGQSADRDDSMGTGSTTGTHRVPVGPGGSGGPGPRAGSAAPVPPTTPPAPDLPEFDLGGDIADVLAGRDSSPRDPTAPGGPAPEPPVTPSGLPRRDTVSRPDAGRSDPLPAGTGGQQPNGSGPTPRPAEPAPPSPAQAQAAAPEPSSAGEKGGAEEEYLPIYAQVESEWFRRRTRPVAAGAGRQPEPLRTSWESVADEGWRAAEQIAKPRVSGTTRAGLPIRQPQAHYVPGSAGPRPARGPAGGPVPSDQSGARPGGPADGSRTPAGSTRSPEAVRGLLSSYHRGLRQGREAGHRPNADGDEFRTE